MAASSRPSSSNAPTTVPRVTPPTCVVIGAGVAGLYAACQLAEAGAAVTVLERAPRTGGRCLTTQHAGLPLDLGAYRVHASHARVLALCQVLGVALVPWTYEAKATCPPPSVPGPDPTRGATRTMWDAVALARGLPAADAEDLHTGYAGTLHAGAVDVGLLDQPQQKTGSTWLVPEAGFQALTDALQRRAEAAGAVVALEQAVLRLADRDLVVLDRRAQRTRTVTFDACVCTLPPAALAATGWEPARALRASLWGHDLLRVYATVGLEPSGSEASALAVKALLPHHPCQQVMDVPPGPRAAHGGRLGSGRRLVQAAYAQGRAARLLHRLSPLERRPMLADGVRRAMGAVGPLREVASRFWEAGIHTWQPAVGGLPDRRLLAAPVQSAAVFLCGEAVSHTHQAWVEGALETAARAVVRCAVQLGLPGPPQAARAAGLGARMPTWSLRNPPPFPFIVVRARVLDVTPWRSRHPGGAGALDAHLGEDCTVLFDTLHAGSDRAHGQLLSLQRGWWTPSDPLAREALGEKYAPAQAPKKQALFE